MFTGPAEAKPSAEKHASKGPFVRWNKVKRKQFTIDDLIVLLEGSDRKREMSLLGGILVDRDRTIVLYKLDERIESKSKEKLTEEQWARVRKVLRRHVDAGEWWKGSVFMFAGKYDAEYAAPKLLQCRQAIYWNPDRAFLCLSNAGPKYRDEALRMVRSGLRSGSEGEVCATIGLVVRMKSKVAVDEVHRLTNSLNWMVRLHAMNALVELDDPRVTGVLEKHLGDLTRNSIGLRILNPFAAGQAIGVSAELRSELIMEAAKRKVKGADKACERILKNSGEFVEGIRVAACLGLDRLDHDRCIQVVGGLLKSWRKKDVMAALEAVTVMEGPRVDTLTDALVGVRKKYPKDEEVQRRVEFALQHVELSKPRRKTSR